MLLPRRPLGRLAAAGRLEKVSVESGEVSTLCDTAARRGASWGEDRTVLFTPVPMGGLMRVRADGGEPERVTTAEPGTSHRWPHVLPGRPAAVFATASDSGRAAERAVAAISLDSGRWRVLVRGATHPRYSPPCAPIRRNSRRSSGRRERTRRAPP